MHLAPQPVASAVMRLLPRTNSQAERSPLPAWHSPHVLLGFGVHASGRLVQQRHPRAAQHAQGKAELKGGQRSRVIAMMPPASRHHGSFGSNSIPCVSARLPASSLSSAGGLLNPGHLRCCGRRSRHEKPR